MDTVHAIAIQAIDQMPPDTRFRTADAETLAEHCVLLRSVGPRIVQSFYDVLYQHAPTAAVFHEGERSVREASLAHWWNRTVEGPLNDDYFAWMAMVGLVHVVREVSNPMMLSMADHVARTVTTVVDESDLDRQEGRRLVDAFRRLTATVSAIITYAYDQAVVSALFDVAGMPEGLLRRLRNQEVDAALTQARVDLGRP